MIKLTQSLSPPESEAIRKALDGLAKVTDRVLPLPSYSENKGLVHSYSVADTAISFRYNPNARKESTQVVFELRAMNRQDYQAAKSLLNAMAPNDEPMTDKRHDW